MENKSDNPLMNNLKEHEQAMIGFNTNNKQRHMMKGPWNHVYNSSNSSAGASSYAYSSRDKGYANISGFSWPPRLYVCSFCKREFRSAQALGGHMNVHRRDRARLRQSPPSPLSPPMELVVEGVDCPPVATAADSIDLSLISSPNPNPNLTYSSAWMIKKPITAATYITDSSRIPSLKSSSQFLVSSFGASTASGLKRLSAARTSTTTTTSNLFNASNNADQLHNTISEVSFSKGLERGGLLRLGFGSGNNKWRKEDVDLELRLGYSS